MRGSENARIDGGRGPRVKAALLDLRRGLVCQGKGQRGILLRAGDERKAQSQKRKNAETSGEAGLVSCRVNACAAREWLRP